MNNLNEYTQELTERELKEIARESYILIGHLGTGEAVYWSKTNGLFVEKDYKYLVVPTQLELKEIKKVLSYIE